MSAGTSKRRLQLTLPSDLEILIERELKPRRSPQLGHGGRRQ